MGKNTDKITTVEPRYSEFQGTGQNYALNQGFHYCQHINNYENASWDKNLHTLLAEFHYKRVRYSGVSLEMRGSEMEYMNFFHIIMA